MTLLKFVNKFNHFQWIGIVFGFAFIGFIIVTLVIIYGIGSIIPEDLTP